MKNISDIKKDRKNYLILNSNTIIDLEKQVNDHIKKGYSPCGNIFIALGGTSNIYYQSVIKENTRRNQW
jgi:hypothetical protein